MSRYRSLLGSAAIFHDLGDEEQESAAALLREVDYQAGEMIFHQDDPADFLGLVISGQVDVFREDGVGKQYHIRAQGIGDVVGDIGLLEDIPRTATVRAAEPTRLAVLDRDGLEQLFRRHPRARATLIQALESRMEAWAAADAERLRKSARRPGPPSF
jgi:CRP-like cAMP-binding protein